MLNGGGCVRRRVGVVIDREANHLIRLRSVVRVNLGGDFRGHGTHGAQQRRVFTRHLGGAVLGQGFVQHLRRDDPLLDLRQFEDVIDYLILENRAAELLDGLWRLAEEFDDLHFLAGIARGLLAQGIVQLGLRNLHAGGAADFGEEQA